MHWSNAVTTKNARTVFHSPWKEHLWHCTIKESEEMYLQIIQILIPLWSWGRGAVRQYILHVFLLRKDEKVDVKHVRLHHKLFHGHFVVSDREESFQAVFGYMKPESAIQWLQKKKKKSSKSRIGHRAKGSKLSNKKESPEVRRSERSITLCCCIAGVLGHIIYSDQLQPPNL